MKKLIALLSILSLPVGAQTPTIVYGASQTAPGKTDEFIVTQPEDAPNPLGNPIVMPVSENSEASDKTDQTSSSTTTNTDDSQNHPVTNTVNQSLPQNPQPFAESTKQKQEQIQDTLYESGDRIYDIQSYPLEDINKITEPLIHPTITDYPVY